MKIRFYHWWIYKLYFKFWTPIFQDRPDMLKLITDGSNAWLEKKEQEALDRRSKFRIIK